MCGAFKVQVSADPEIILAVLFVNSVHCLFVSVASHPRTSMPCLMWHQKQWTPWTTPNGTLLWSSLIRIASMASRPCGKESPPTPTAVPANSTNRPSNWGRPALTCSLVQSTQIQSVVHTLQQCCSCFCLPVLTWATVLRLDGFLV